MDIEIPTDARVYKRSTRVLDRARINRPHLSAWPYAMTSLCACAHYLAKMASYSESIASHRTRSKKVFLDCFKQRQSC